MQGPQGVWKSRGLLLLRGGSAALAAKLKPVSLAGNRRDSDGDVSFRALSSAFQLHAPSERVGRNKPDLEVALREGAIAFTGQRRRGFQEGMSGIRRLTGEATNSQYSAWPLATFRKSPCRLRVSAQWQAKYLCFGIFGRFAGAPGAAGAAGAADTEQCAVRLAFGSQGCAGAGRMAGDGLRSKHRPPCREPKTRPDDPIPHEFEFHSTRGGDHNWGDHPKAQGAEPSFEQVPFKPPGQAGRKGRLCEP